jgi:hypothetical protein
MAGFSMSGPVQMAYAVDDVREAAAGWAPVGVGPFFVVEHVELRASRIAGVPAMFDHSSAFGWWGGVMFELICQHVAPGSGTDRLVGTAGLHHVAHFVDDLDAVSAGLVRDGHAEILRAETAAGMRFAFYDGGVARDHVIEICEREPGVQNFYDMVRDASIGWDGSDPVRTL